MNKTTDSKRLSVEECEAERDRIMNDSRYPESLKRWLIDELDVVRFEQALIIFGSEANENDPTDSE